MPFTLYYAVSKSEDLDFFFLLFLLCYASVIFLKGEILALTVLSRKIPIPVINS